MADAAATAGAEAAAMRGRERGEENAVPAKIGDNPGQTGSPEAFVRHHSAEGTVSEAGCNATNEHDSALGDAGATDASTESAVNMQLAHEKSLLTEDDARENGSEGGKNDLLAEGLLAVYDEAAAELGIAPCDALRDALLSAIESRSSLLHLKLRDCGLNTLAGAAVAEVLARDAELTNIDLDVNELGDEGAVLVAQALLSHPSLFRLDMCSNGIGPSGLRALSKLVAASKTLLCLNLSDNAFWSRVSTFAPASFSALAPLGKALATSECKLQLLSLEQCEIDHKSFSALVDGLVKNEVLVNLKLGENNLDARCANSVSRLLRMNRALTNLDLRGNSLGDAGAATMAGALAVNTTLRCLVLWRNGIHASGIAALAAPLAENRAVQILDLGANAVCAQGAAALKTALVRNASIHTLGLASTQLGEEGGVAIAEVVEGNRRLERLDLRRNHLGVAGLMALRLAMRTNTKLSEIALDANTQESVEMLELMESFQAEVFSLCAANGARARQQPGQDSPISSLRSRTADGFSAMDLLDRAVKVSSEASAEANANGEARQPFVTAIEDDAVQDESSIDAAQQMSTQRSAETQHSHMEGIDNSALVRGGEELAGVEASVDGVIATVDAEAAEAETTAAAAAEAASAVVEAASAAEAAAAEAAAEVDATELANATLHAEADAVAQQESMAAAEAAVEAAIEAAVEAQTEADAAANDVYDAIAWAPAVVDIAGASAATVVEAEEAVSAEAEAAVAERVRDSTIAQGRAASENPSGVGMHTLLMSELAVSSCIAPESETVPGGADSTSVDWLGAATPQDAHFGSGPAGAITDVSPPTPLGFEPADMNAVGNESDVQEVPSSLFG